MDVPSSVAQATTWYNIAMVITYVGGYCFKISAGDTTLAINPPSASTKFNVSKFGADVVFIPTADPTWSGEETATHGDKEPFIIQSPGAYEVGDMVATGFASEGAEGPFGNTIYNFEFDGMRVLLLGALASPKLSQEVRSNIDEVHIVFVPLGGGTLDPKEAHELVVSLEPNVIIPYAVNGGDDLKLFLKTAGAHEVKPVEKFTIRAKEIVEMQGEVVVLQ